MRPHVLDASALYRFMTDSPGADVVAGVFADANAANASVLMSVISWGEVYYGLAKRLGVAKTESALARMLQGVPLVLVPVERDDAVRAARIKVQYNVPYADAFAAAVAGQQGVVVTSDETHFRRVPKLRLVLLPSHKQ